MLLCHQEDFFRSIVEPLDCWRSELCMVSTVIYRFVEFDTCVSCHVPSCSASPETAVMLIGELDY